MVFVFIIMCISATLSRPFVTSSRVRSGYHSRVLSEA